MLVLGIDPGSHSTGYAFLQRHSAHHIQVLEYGTITAPVRADLPQRLKYICQELEPRLDQYRPQILAMEESFFAKNARTALVLGHARGAIMATALRHEVEVAEFSPRTIKKTITGSGAASKEKVAQMMKVLLQLTEIEGSSDATDALAIAWTYLHQPAFDSPMVRPQSPEVLQLLARSKNRNRR